MRPLYQIAQDISREWKKPHYTAVPYLQAMKELHTIDDNYMFDSGQSVVRYFLSNAGQFKGEQARKLKQELRSML